MSLRPIYVLVCIAAAAGCTQAEQTQQEQPAAAAQPAVVTQTMPSTGVCWSRAAGGDPAGRESPLDSATINVNGHNIKLCYSRPSMRGRAIFGSLVPYDRPWRLGANEATVIHMPVAGSVAGIEVGPGAYSMYAVPDREQWKIVLNRNAQRWGIPINAQVTNDDINLGFVPVASTSAPVEMLTARFEPAPGGATLIFQWERTEVRVPIRVNAP